MSLLNNTSYNDTLIKEFKNLHGLLRKNTYIRDTTNKLQQLIEDATSNVQILFIGKEGVGKSSLINALLGRELIPIVETSSTKVNMFIKYSDTEHLEVTFYDGYVAKFDMNKLQLFIYGNLEIIDIILEHINYITVYIKHDLLKKVTLIDTQAIEIGKDTTYFSETMLNRVDEIFWVIRGDSPLIEDELILLRKISARHMKPYVVVNAIGECTQGAEAFIASENSRYSQYIEEIIGVSALLANDSRIKNNAQNLIDSNFPLLTKLIKTIADNYDKKQEHTSYQLNDWLIRVRKEFELISVREPYLSSIEQLKHYQLEKTKEYSKEQRDLAIIKTFEEEYKQCSAVFNSVQTLYQMLKVLSENLYLRDEYTESYEEKATNYLQTIRSYRTVFSEYVTQINNMQRHIKSSEEKDGKLHLKLSTKGNKVQLQDLIIVLNDKQALLSAIFSSIKSIEKEIVTDLGSVQQRMNELAKVKLQSILKQVEQLNEKRHLEYKSLIASRTKLDEFDCLTEAQKYISTVIKEEIENNVVNQELKQQMLHTIEFITATELEHVLINKDLQIDDQLTVPIVVQFEQQYPFNLLKLEESDIVSQLSPLPLQIAMDIH